MKNVRRTLTLIVWLASPAFMASPLAAQTAEIEGAWRAETYIMAAGAEYTAEGRIFFTESDWQVLFFTLDETGAVVRASAEGGTYTLEGDSLTFVHLHNLSVGDAIDGRAAAPLQKTYRSPEDAAVEPATAKVEGQRLTLTFPGGNRLIFSRSSK
jgi:hypothetical protein